MKGRGSSTIFFPFASRVYKCLVALLTNKDLQGGDRLTRPLTYRGASTVILVVSLPPPKNAETDPDSTAKYCLFAN
jgi:hypothetical protein